jgi:hypothetical protein
MTIILLPQNPGKDKPCPYVQLQIALDGSPTRRAAPGY